LPEAQALEHLLDHVAFVDEGHDPHLALTGRADEGIGLSVVVAGENKFACFASDGFNFIVGFERPEFSNSFSECFSSRDRKEVSFSPIIPHNRTSGTKQMAFSHVAFALRACHFMKVFATYWLTHVILFHIQSIPMRSGGYS
jgi:hypothetical protein